MATAGNSQMIQIEVPSGFFLDDEQLEKQRDELNRYYVARGRMLLDEYNLVAPDDRQATAEDCVLGGALLLVQADTPDEVTPQLQSYYNSVTTAGKCSCLIIGAPRKSQVSLCTEKQMRIGNFKSFSKDVDIEHSKVHRNVSSPSEAKDAIETFVRSSAYNAWAIYIIFDGHGNPDGLLFDNGSATFQEFLDYIDDAAKANCNFTPAEIRVVFSQCYGYHYEKHLTGKFEKISDITALASEAKPETTVVLYSRCDVDGDRVSVHKDLQAHIPKMAVQVQETLEQNSTFGTSMDVSGLESMEYEFS